MITFFNDCSFFQMCVMERTFCFVGPKSARFVIFYFEFQTVAIGSEFSTTLYVLGNHC